VAGSKLRNWRRQPYNWLGRIPASRAIADIPSRDEKLDNRRAP
jgi:hypothetical protein